LKRKNVQQLSEVLSAQQLSTLSEIVDILNRFNLFSIGESAVNEAKQVLSAAILFQQIPKRLYLFVYHFYDVMPGGAGEKKKFLVFSRRGDSLTEIMRVDIMDDDPNAALKSVIENLRGRSYDVIYTGDIPMEGFLGKGDLIEHNDSDAAPWISYRRLGSDETEFMTSAGIRIIHLSPLV
jgi:hypothetical protein